MSRSSIAPVQSLLTFDIVGYRPDDLALLKWGYKRSRELARRMACYRGEYAPGHPTFSDKSDARCTGDGASPIEIDAPDIQYDEEDEKVLEDYVRKYGMCV